MVDEDLGVREGGSVAVMNDELVALYPVPGTCLRG